MIARACVQGRLNHVGHHFGLSPLLTTLSEINGVMCLLLFIRSPDPHGDFSGIKIHVDETVITPGPANVELTLRAGVGCIGEDSLGELLGEG